MKNFRTFDLAVLFYRQCQTLHLKSCLKDQLDRASSSIALNICEGRGRPTLRDQLRFYNMAMGSLRECQGILTLANLNPSTAWDTLDKLGAHLYRLIKRAV